MTTIYVFYITSMPTEAGVAAFAQFLGSPFEAVPTTIQEAKSGALFDFVPGPSGKLIFLGNYWDQMLDRANQERDLNKSGWEIYVYSFGSSAPTWISQLQVHYAVCEHLGPAAYFLSKLREWDLMTGLVSYACRQHLRALELIDDRILQRNLMETQCFLSGLYNFDTSDKYLTSFDRFLALFQGDVTLEQLKTLGAVVVNSQMQLAAERARNNCGLSTLANGMKVIITDAPELINLTHDALLTHSPEVSATLIASLKFSNDKEGLLETKIAYSIRKNEATQEFKDVHLGNYLKDTIGGGGSANAAGGRVEFNLQIPF